MKTCVIVNPEAGSAEQFEQLQTLIRQEQLECWKTEKAGDACALTKKALDEGVEQIAVAGGDGTVNEVVNGVMEHERPARLAVIPLGTGNDLARTLALPDDPRDALAIMEIGDEQTLDVIRVESAGRTSFCINVSAGGFSGQVDEVLDEETKEQWGPLAYLFGAVNALPDLHDYDIYVSYDGGPEEDIDVFNVIVANGRTAAGGNQVAPMANPQDGLLDVVIVEQCSMTELAGVARRLLGGNYQQSPCVQHRRVRQVHVAADPGMWFNIDGELLTKEPVTFTAVSGALRFVVGPDYQADPNSR